MLYKVNILKEKRVIKLNKVVINTIYLEIVFYYI